LKQRPVISKLKGMASMQKPRPSIEQLLQEFENASATIRADMAARTAGEMLYDEAVVGFMIAGRSVEEAILCANQLYPSEAFALTPASVDDLEAHYWSLKRIFIADCVREFSATPPPAQRFDAIRTVQGNP
jgi:hypothetical protein